MFWDAIVIATLVISSIIAFFRGFVREVLTIVGVIGGAAGAYYGGPDAIPVFRSLMGVSENTQNAQDQAQEQAKLFDLIPYELVADSLAYGSIFLVIVILLAVISHYISAATRKSGLSLLDRSAGVLFGVLRGIVLLGLLYLPVHIFVESSEKKQWFEGSRSIVYVELTADFLSQYFPDFGKEPEKMFDVKDIKKVIEARELLREQDQKVKDKAAKQDENLQDIENGGDNAPPSTGQGYEDELRKKLKDLLQEEPAEIDVPPAKDVIPPDESNSQLPGHE